jgi:DNA-binding HxlR family transcriptional regulator
MPCDALHPAPLLSTRCAVGLALGIIGGKWKPRILAILGERMRRFRELERCLPQISRKVLVEQLRELEAEGVVDRRVYPQIPLRVEYSLSATGARALPVLRALEEFGLSMIAERSVPEGTAQRSA